MARQDERQPGQYSFSHALHLQPRILRSGLEMRLSRRRIDNHCGARSPCRVRATHPPQACLCACLVPTQSPPHSAAPPPALPSAAPQCPPRTGHFFTRSIPHKLSIHRARQSSGRRAKPVAPAGIPLTDQPATDPPKTLGSGCRIAATVSSCWIPEAKESWTVVGNLGMHSAMPLSRLACCAVRPRICTVCPEVSQKTAACTPGGRVSMERLSCCRRNI